MVVGRAVAALEGVVCRHLPDFDAVQQRKTRLKDLSNVEGPLVVEIFMVILIILI